MSCYTNKGSNCSIETHTIGASNNPADFVIQANAKDQVIFEDFTFNHNKTILQLTGNALVDLIVTITTRDCQNEIEEVIPKGESRIFQVEDFKRLTVSNTSATLNVAFRAFIQKTFCICCNEKKGACHVATHTVGRPDANTPFIIPVPANAKDKAIFEDFTGNHNKTYLDLRTSATVIVTISTRECPTKIVQMIPAGGRRIFQVEDFERLTVSNTTSTNASLFAFIQKTFCICCKDKKANKRKKKINRERQNEQEKWWVSLSVIEHVDYYLKKGETVQRAIKLTAVDRLVSKRSIYQEYYCQ